MKLLKTDITALQVASDQHRILYSESCPFSQMDTQPIQGLLIPKEAYRCSAGCGKVLSSMQNLKQHEQTTSACSLSASFQPVFAQQLSPRPQFKTLLVVDVEEKQEDDNNNSEDTNALRKMVQAFSNKTIKATDGNLASSTPSTTLFDAFQKLIHLDEKIAKTDRQSLHPLTVLSRLDGISIQSDLLTQKITKFVCKLQKYLREVVKHSPEICRRFVLQARSFTPPGQHRLQQTRSLNLLDQSSEGDTELSYRNTWGRLLIFIIGITSNLEKGLLPSAVSKSLNCDEVFVEKLIVLVKDFVSKILIEDTESEVLAEAGLNVLYHVLGQTSPLNAVNNETGVIVYLFLIACMSNPTALPSTNIILTYSGRIKMLLSTLLQKLLFLKMSLHNT
jgi:hypothetical protein